MTSDPAVRVIVGRLVARMAEIGDAMIDAYQEHIPDYAAMASPGFDDDVRTISLKNLAGLLDHLEHGHLLDDDELDEIRASGARRLHQGVSLDAVLHAYRLWGELAWEAIVGATDRDDTAERDAALRMAGRVIQHLNLVSTEVTRGYLTELAGVRSDRDELMRQLVEQLVTAPSNREQSEKLADALAKPLARSYVALAAAIVAEVGNPSRLARAAANRRAVAAAERVATRHDPDALVALRHEHVVVLLPLRKDDERDRTRRLGAELAGTLASDGYVLGSGGCHGGIQGTRASYREAIECLDSAIGPDAVGRAVEFERVLVNSILRGSPLTERLVRSVVEPLREYDRKKGADLERTLVAYIASGFSASATARAVCVHPNTIVYRLGKIREVCGHDPRDPDDLTAIALAVRAAQGLPRVTARSSDPHPDGDSPADPAGQTTI